MIKCNLLAFLFNLAVLYLNFYNAYLKKYILWIKTIHYPNKVRSHLVIIAPMVPFAPKSTSKLDLRCTLDIR